MRAVRISNRRRAITFAATSALVVGGLTGVLIPQAAASAQAYNFQLDGDVAGGVSPASFDWTNFLAPCGGGGPSCVAGTAPGDVTPTAITAAESTAGYVASAATPDYMLPDQSTFTGGTKDTLPISGWGCNTSNSVTSKDDLLNAYAVAYRDPLTQHSLVFFGAEKRSNNGDNNIAIWLLQGDIKCSGGGFNGAHANGDILLAAAFTNGGTTATITVFEWEGVTAQSVGGLVLINTDTQICTAASTLPPTPAAPLAACAITNTAAGGVLVPWNSQLSNAPSSASGGSTLDTQEFYEGGLDLTALTGNNANPSLTPCINTLITDSRTSQSPTATLKDFVRQGLHTCGTLHVNKYIDSNASGTLNAASNPPAVTDDQTSGAVVSGFHFTVTGPSPSSATVCAGTTDTTGALVCSTGTLSSLLPGDYTVTEDGVPAVSVPGQPYYWYNTDPGNATTSRTITVSSSGATANFGNACKVTANLTVNKTATATGFFLWYKVGPGGTRVDITSGLTTNGNNATATIANTFTQGNTNPAGGPDTRVYWGFGINGPGAGESTTEATNSPLDLASDGYRTNGTGCVQNDTTNFAPVTITGVKYKDINGNGTRDSGEGLLANFGTFRLMQGGSQIGNDVSTDASGVFTFNSVNPGVYTIHEVNPTGWVQTQPASGDIHVTVTLGSPSTVTKDDSNNDIAFGDTPNSTITVTFNPGAKLGNGTTDATHASSISCVDKNSASVGSTTTNSLTTGNVQLKQSSVVCTITYVDP